MSMTTVMMVGMAAGFAQKTFRDSTGSDDPWWLGPTVMTLLMSLYAIFYDAAIINPRIAQIMKDKVRLDDLKSGGVKDGNSVLDIM